MQIIDDLATELTMLRRNPDSLSRSVISDYLLEQQYLRNLRWNMNDSERRRELLEKRRQQIGPNAVVGKTRRERYYQMALLNSHIYGLANSGGI